jgi:hypothetical protein
MTFCPFSQAGVNLFFHSHSILAFFVSVLFPFNFQRNTAEKGGLGYITVLFQLMAAAPINKLEDFLKLVWKTLTQLPLPPCGEKRGACVRAQK